jgi:uncharacterized membrane protein YgdD (TMEM256/DUF423 family)
MMLAAFSGLVSIALGAFAAHGVTDPKAREWLTTGAHYQAIHALACLACATLMQVGARQARFAPPFFLAGTVLFCGSLYAMALGAPRVLGAVTPLGGLAFMVGWGVMFWSARGVDQSPAR